MPTLYRTYRPKTFSEVIGQNHVSVTLQNEISTGRLAHAYLFSGPRGVGKTTVARLFAKAVNCEKRKGKSAEPCNTCSSCTDIMKNADVDLIEIDAASNTGVDNVRENIIEAAKFTPTRQTYKVYIIDEVHMLSTAAFNALLKILEEPPAHVIFILATTEIHKVPETILSRCQRFDFKRIPHDAIVKRLQEIAQAEKVHIDDTVLASIARLSEGSARDAESLLGQVLTLGGKSITENDASIVLPHSNLESALELVTAIVRRDASSAIGILHQTEQDGIDLIQFNRDIVALLRQTLLARVAGSLAGLTHTDMDPDVATRAGEATRDLTVPALTAMLTIFIDAERQLKASDIPTLPLELAIVTIIGDDAPPTGAGGAPPAAVPAASSSQPQATVALKKESPPRSTAAVKASSSDVSAIASQWPAILQSIRAENQSLALTLRVCEPVSIENGTLTVRCDYAFHAERLQDPKSTGLIASAIAEICGTDVSITTLVEKRERPVQQETSTTEQQPRSQSSGSVQEGDELIDGLIEAFGGKIA